MLEIMALGLLAGGAGLVTMIWRQRSWQQHHLEQQEEEVLTQYEPTDLVPPEEAQVSLPLQNQSEAELAKDLRQWGWEFKIVRTNRNLFQNSTIFSRVCAEEAEAGWILLEKLDERRLRFKRPMTLRELIKPETLKRDPYRCYYRSAGSFTWLGIIAMLIAIILPAYLGYTLVATMLAQTRTYPRTPPTPPLPTSSPLR